MQKNDAGLQPNQFSNFRWADNIHILFWLLKDMCWAMFWRPGGLFMIAPTLGVAIYILIKSRHDRSDLFHNIAVCIWILANSLWMAGEFFLLELRPYAVMLFIAGLSVLLIYYIFFFRTDRRRAKEPPLTIK
jgi:hypothetical protein